MANYEQHSEPVAIQTAVRCIWARRLRKQKPLGHVRPGGLWLPDSPEERSCCFEVKGPSDKDKWALYDHCLTIKHIAHLFGVDPLELSRAYRRSIKATRPTQNLDPESAQGYR